MINALGRPVSSFLKTLKIAKVVGFPILVTKQVGEGMAQYCHA